MGMVKSPPCVCSTPLNVPDLSASAAVKLKLKKITQKRSLIMVCLPVWRRYQLLAQRKQLLVTQINWYFQATSSAFLFLKPFLAEHQTFLRKALAQLKLPRGGLCT